LVNAIENVKPVCEVKKVRMNLDQCLVDEILDASQKMGIVRKKKNDLHKLAQANHNFLHYRWL
jgi:small subunit ribosomal protein S7